MLPNSQNAIPKTHAQRVQIDPKIEQAPGGIRVQLEDPEDPPGEEMTKSARVWKTYVQEADQLDKEMVEGRNSSLDVLLIFVSTTLSSVVITFLNETIPGRTVLGYLYRSLGDLKPDTGESSARSLLAISQKLDAIVTDRQPTFLPAQTVSLDDFSPSRSAVMVNILWLLSLSLSVVVSLIAMLAKEWCYKFMTGRSGPIYDQARKRQQKWNGIERWKMQELVNILPGLMHAALLLFAVGLCIYLWDIHTGVAIVVIVVTAAAVCIYILTTVLPLFDRFCPYSTPATLMLNPLHRVLYLTVEYAYNRVLHTNWPTSLLKQLTDILKPHRGNHYSQGKDDIYAHMDTVTSQMIAWMIINCEDSRSVHIAYQAIAGARPMLPLAPILGCEAAYTICQHVKSTVQLSAESGRFTLKDPNMLQAALRYWRATSVLVQGEIHADSKFLYDRHEIANIHLSLVDVIKDTASPTELTSNVATCLRFVRLDRDTLFIRDQSLENISLEPLITWAISILSNYSGGNPSNISVPSILMLVESCAYYMSKRWYTLEEPERHSAVMQLVHIYIQSDQNNRPLAQAASFALAAASFAVNTYPGGEFAPSDPASRTERAIQVLQDYLSSPDEWNLDKTFAFGFIGLLRHIDQRKIFLHPSLESGVYSTLDRAFLGSLQSPFTIPVSYTWTAHVKASRAMSQPQFIENLEITGVEPERTVLHVLLMQHGCVNHKMLVPILATLRHAQNEDLQDVCIHTLFSISIGRHWAQIKDTLKNKPMLGTLFDPFSKTNNTAFIVAGFFFRLLLANIMLCNDCDLAQRQSTLADLLEYKAEYMVTKSTAEKVLPSEERILEHAAENIAGNSESKCMHDTLQLVSDFCEASTTECTGPELESVDPNEPLRWAAKLEAIKNAFISSGSQIDDEKSVWEQHSATTPAANGAEPWDRQGRAHPSEQVEEASEKKPS
ncbi:activating signal cointegrator 1 complex subunit 3 [Ceratobasidium sp. AG-Ba]|nr:activating signal cointegrator 1 complex subunit 3 [Ceratobasidium sp. AG-Ba]